ncbi:hypothetical protein McanCB56680_007685 [Microsporum canis]|uniref:Uncharacterized protein n=1 Tax=Arthroderma otae (strain ATCC MYA-4605 / CBS 113480) TaxID=554155 RepID=C5FYY7_ARTOC|nr:conserved hypothetical protein [Microsporum canis CBS 113480]EEQ34735.1 conserved hypothetical protein [Microsporum canis CBS 113480]
MTDRGLRFRRHETDCEKGMQFYACSKGLFRGCCAVDPCNTGECPDNAKSPSSPTTSRQTSRATQTQSPTLHSTSTSRTTTSHTTIASKTKTSLSITSMVSTASTITTLTISSPPTTATETVSTAIPQPTIIHLGPSRGAFIGGIVGAVVVALLLCCSACFWLLIRRRRKKAGKWEGTRAMILCRRKKEATTIVASPSSEKPQDHGPCGELDGSKYRAEMFAPSDVSTLTASPRTCGDSPSIGSSTTVSPSTQSIAWSNEKIATQSAMSTPLRGFGSVSTMAQGNAINTIPELPATNSPQLPAPREPDSSSSATSSLRPPHLPPSMSPFSREGVQLTVTTPEGIVLRPNLHDSPAQQHQQYQELEAPLHVMSFMEYSDRKRNKET